MSAITTRRPSLGETQDVTPVSFVRRHPVVSYYVLALAISGVIALPMIAVAQGWTTAPVPFALHYLGAFGPMLAALILTAYLGGAEALRELWSRCTRWRIGWAGFTGAVLLPVALFAGAVTVVVAMGGPFPDLTKLGVVNYLPDLGAGVLLLWLVTYGFGEEIGWRGFALPRVQNGRSALMASLIVWLMWAGWHFQYFFYLDTYTKLGLVMFPLFALLILPGSIILTWLYNETRGSVLAVAAWHALFDLLSAAKISEGTISMLMSVGVMIWAVAIVVWYRGANLARAPKQVL